MRIAVTGSSGLIGSHLVPALRADGHDVLRLVRRTPRTADEHRWAPEHHEVDAAVLADVDAVVNLAGAPISPRLWTASYERRLLTSRVDSTVTVSTALAAAAKADPTRPRVLLSGSGVTFYGDTGDRPVTEDEPQGTGFMAELPAQWEEATGTAEAAGVRVVHLRTGLVLGRGAPLMNVLGLVFSLGLGGQLGSGRQYWPWISLADQVGAIRHLLAADVSGPVNLAAPNPVTNAEFTETLARVLHRPALLRVPGFVLPLVLRDFARASVIGGQRAVPAKLLATGYSFTHPDLEDALRVALGRG